MAKSLEEHLADYLAGLARGPWTARYNQDCLAMWERLHGKNFRMKVEKLAREKWKK